MYGSEPACVRLTPVCSADGKIRLATLELSCLLLKQQVVTSTGCIIKDVHLACLEVRAPYPVGPEGEREEVGEAEAAGSCPEPPSMVSTAPATRSWA